MKPTPNLRALAPKRFEIVDAQAIERARFKSHILQKVTGVHQSGNAFGRPRRQCAYRGVSPLQEYRLLGGETVSHAFMSSPTRY